MPSSGPLHWKALKPHLNELLPGWRLEDKTHSRFLRCERIRPEPFALPRGAHGSAVPQIRRGDLRRLLRFFGKLDEAKTRIPQLF